MLGQKTGGIASLTRCALLLFEVAGNQQAPGWGVAWMRDGCRRMQVMKTWVGAVWEA